MMKDECSGMKESRFRFYLEVPQVHFVYCILFSSVKSKGEQYYTEHTRPSADVNKSLTAHFAQTKLKKEKGSSKQGERRIYSEYVKEE